MQYKNAYGILKQVNLLLLHPKCSKKIKVNFIYQLIIKIDRQVSSQIINLIICKTRDIDSFIVHVYQLYRIDTIELECFSHISFVKTGW